MCYVYNFAVRILVYTKQPLELMKRSKKNQANEIEMKRKKSEKQIKLKSVERSKQKLL